MNKRFKRIYIEITNVCNLECRFCPKTIREKGFISVEDFERILVKIKPFTDYVYLHIKGEPLLHPNIDKVLDLCEKHKLKVNLTTNGMLLKGKKDILMTKNALRQINISLHSFEQNDIKYLTQQEYLDDIISTIKELNSKTNIIVSLRLWNLQKESTNVHNRMIMDTLEREFGISNIETNIKNGMKLSDRIYLNQDFEFSWPNISGQEIAKTGRCYGLIQQIGILVDGTVVPCCLDQDGIIDLGNVYEKDFADIVNQQRSNDIINGFKQNKLIEGLCQRCGYVTKFML